MLYVGVKFVFRIFNLFRPITNWCYVCKREILNLCDLLGIA